MAVVLLIIIIINTKLIKSVLCSLLFYLLPFFLNKELTDHLKNEFFVFVDVRMGGVGVVMCVGVLNEECGLKMLRRGEYTVLGKSSSFTYYSSYVRACISN